MSPERSVALDLIDDVRFLTHWLHRFVLLCAIAFAGRSYAMTLLSQLRLVDDEPRLHLSYDVKMPPEITEYDFYVAWLVQNAIFYMSYVSVFGWHAIIAVLLAHCRRRFQGVALVGRALFAGVEGRGRGEAWRRAVVLRIARFAQCHQEALRFAKCCEDVFSPYFFGYCLIITGILCFACFVITDMIDGKTDDATAGIIILPGALIMLFLQCKLGQDIIDASTSVAEAIYNSNWESHISKEFARDLIIIMIRAQKPATLTAYSLYPFSLRTFAMVVNTAYTYFMFLRST